MNLAEKFDVKGSAWQEVRDAPWQGKVLFVALWGFLGYGVPLLMAVLAVHFWMNADLLNLALAAAFPPFAIGLIAKSHGWIYFLRCRHGEDCWCGHESDEEEL